MPQIEHHIQSFLMQSSLPWRLLAAEFLYSRLLGRPVILYSMAELPSSSLYSMAELPSSCPYSMIIDPYEIGYLFFYVPLFAVNLYSTLFVQSETLIIFSMFLQMLFCQGYICCLFYLLNSSALIF